MSSYLSHAKVIPMTQAGADATVDSSITMNLPSTLGATCCAWLSPNSQTENILVGAGGVDRQAHIFSIPSLLNAVPDQIPEEIMTLHLHTGPISSIAPSRSFEHVLTSSWDGLLGVFSLPTPSNPLEETHDLPAEPKSYLPGQNSKKKRKVAGAAGDSQTGGWRKQPDMVMRGHTARIGGAIWDKEDRNRVWSAAWDGSVRGWEADIGYNSVLKVRKHRRTEERVEC
jgi:ribosome biogenesis protein YTM1